MDADADADADAAVVIIDDNAVLDYALLQISPSLNRYEAFGYAQGKVEKLSVASLQPLSQHLPVIKDLYAQGIDTSFKLEHPVNQALWFKKSTLTRFLHIISSPDFVNDTKAIEGEISQLEEARKFHLSLYSKDNAQVASSDSSKNELLQAMDLRLATLRTELGTAFNQAAGATCSYAEVSDLLDFSQNFGATLLKGLLCKFLELSQIKETANLQVDDELPPARVSRNVDDNNWTSKPMKSEMPVKYSVSPAKAAQIERRGSSESDSSSDTSEVNQRSAERSRPLIRSASPKRSASPMRRVQIGRSGSRRAAAVTIKNLHYIPARDKTFPHRDSALDSGEEEGSGRRTIDVRRISVQDAISLFESKQTDQSGDVQKKNISLGPSKSVLRRWSAGVVESYTQGQQQDEPNDFILRKTNDVGDFDMGIKRESDFTCENQHSISAPEGDVKFEIAEEKVKFPVSEQEQVNEKVGASAEWSQLKEVELNQMLKKMMATQPVSRSRKPQPTSKPPEQRGGSYNNYTKKRDEKLRGQNAGKQAEQEAQFKEMQKILDQKKTVIAANSGGKRTPLPKAQKSIKNPPLVTNPSKETSNSKPSVTKKVISKPSPLPATRKSWPSAPAPRTTVVPQVKTFGAVSSASTTPTRRKSQIAQPAPPQPKPKVEKSQQQKGMKETTPKNVRVSKVADEKQQHREIKSSKLTKSKVGAATKDSAKPGLYNKPVKKSTVVPVESKPVNRKVSGSSPTVARTKRSSPSLESKKKPNLMENKKNEEIICASKPEHQNQDELSLANGDADVRSETLNSQQICSETLNSVQLATDDVDNIKNMEQSSPNNENEEETIISPRAWVDIEEHEKMPQPCEFKPYIASPDNNIAPAEISSPQVRHSLSQMLQEECSEPDTNEWGNAENPPVIISHKESSKGFKRLLKFARKNKGDSNSTGWSSPSVFSEGEEEAEESRVNGRRNSESLLRKATLHGNKNYGQEKSSSREAYDRNIDAEELSSAQYNVRKFDAHSLHKGHVSSTASSTNKGTRSFFSLSAFRGNKPN